MSYRLLIALGAGLVSAVVFASATTGPLLMRMVLFILTPLALFLAGLGLGPRAAVIAGLSGSFLVLVALGPAAALVFVISQIAPVVVLCYLVSLNRVDADGTVEWYPVGRVVIAAALMAGVIAVLAVLMTGANTDALRENVRGMLDQFVAAQLQSVPDAPKLTPAELDELAVVLVGLFPAALAAWAFISFLFSLWLAGRVTLASGRLMRPWPDLAAISYPPTTPLLLAVATGISFFEGMPTLIAKGFAGPLFFAYALLGLAVIHYITRGRSWRPFALWGLYASLFVLSTVTLPAIALLGLADAIWPMRKLSPPPDEPPTT